jgi:transposase
VTHRHAAGIDVHANVHWVAVPLEDAPAPPADHPANLPAHVRSFGTCTADLMELADWLTQCGVKTIAMESTGIYWITLFELLESRGFEVLLVEPRQSRHVPGRPKSDVLDCQWLQRLHTRAERPDTSRARLASRPAMDIILAFSRRGARSEA